MFAAPDCLPPSLQARAKKLSGEIEKGLKDLPPSRGRDRDPVADLAAAMEELEYERESGSLSLTAEKEIVRKIANLKKQQQVFTSFAALRTERTFLNSEMDRLAAKRTELRAGIKKMELVQRISEASGAPVAPGDIITDEVCVSVCVRQPGACESAFVNRA